MTTERIVAPDFLGLGVMWLDILVSVSWTLQSVEVERLMQQMKALRLIPQCWQSSDFPNRSPISPSSRTSPLRPSGRRSLDKRQSPGSMGFGSGGTEKRRKQSPSEGSRVVNRQQMTKLRDYFSNITMSPVKQVHTGQWCTWKTVQSSPMPIQPHLLRNCVCKRRPSNDLTP